VFGPKSGTLAIGTIFDAIIDNIHGAGYSLGIKPIPLVAGMN
jgi:hypothetical protein